MISASNNTNQIQVTVLFFGAARDAVGHGQVELDLGGAATAGNALENILEKYPELRRFGRSLLLAVNQEYARPEQVVQNGDELAVFPPVSGGAMTEAPEAHGDRDFFELTTEPFSCVMSALVAK